MEGVFLDPKRLEREKAHGIWPDRVLTDYLDLWATRHPELPALIAHRQENATTTRFTWRELARRVNAIASGLATHGVAKGDVVSFQLPNWWEFIGVHLACVRLGAISNPLMPIFREHELSFMLKHSESKVLIAPARFRGFDHHGLALRLQRELPTLKRIFLVGGESGRSAGSRASDSVAPDHHPVRAVHVTFNL